MFVSVCGINRDLENADLKKHDTFLEAKQYCQRCAVEYIETKTIEALNLSMDPYYHKHAMKHAEYLKSVLANVYKMEIPIRIKPDFIAFIKEL